ncbi:GumC family protein [Flagellimonas algicola]|uniref:non-specific protein-tyrosine kinase n=1 Tax=Flagellimonas algicola TaxID=2583815 RepID=A0ABY2WML8_9FLAO|nr:tyrosine-protein kinase [Allomuricauda algicola]TMU56220.1 polysaccharide biosynthesis tyrosine autokinase [Allomuricauda algicola]
MKTENSEALHSNETTSDLLKPILKNWKWFVASIFVAILLAFLYIRYAVPEYGIHAKIKILEDQNSTSELGAFSDLGVLGGGRNNVQDEIESLNSRMNLMKVVEDLGLNTKVIALGSIKNTVLYDDQPFNVSFLAPDSIVQKTEHEFFVTLDSQTSFDFANEEDAPFSKESFGTPIASSLGDLIITPKSTLDIGKLKGKKYKVKVSPIANVAEYYQRNILITVTDMLSNIISINLNDAVKKRGKDVINTLISIYNQNAVDDKKAIADRTSSFINDRIADIYGDLSNVDQSAEDFKSGRGITDIGAQTNVNLNIGATNQQELQNASVQLDIASSMKDLVDGENGYELLPTNVGLNDETIAGTTARYNELALERKRLLESSNEKNPIIVNLDRQLDGLKRSMKSSLNSVENNLTLQVNSLSSQLSRINSRIYSAPKNERALRDITRQQQTTESLYLYLLQKREESQITYASASPKSKIIDSAYLMSKDPVSPKKPVIYLASFILGLLVPFGFFYLKDMMDNKVHNKIELEKAIFNKAPVIAELPKIGKKASKLINGMDRSVLGESLRILRTNLNYVLKNKNGQERGHMILVTSSVPGEGKTFISSNLAMVFASTKKRVLLVGADIRNPKLQNFYSDLGLRMNGELGANGKSKRGLTEFLHDDNLQFKDTITPAIINDNKVDIVFSGKIPPNPAELLMSGRLKEFMDLAIENYDYVVVDSAPMLVVTDTLLISDFAHQILYVTKAGVTDRKVLEYPIKLVDEKKVKNLSFVVNGVKETNLGYGRNYGYGYGRTVKKWWNFN